MSLKSGQQYMLSHTALYVLFTLFTGIYQAPRASLVAQMVKICLQCRRPGFYPWVRKISWRRAWLPNPVFLPGGFYGQRNLAGYSPWGHKESDTTEQLTLWLSSSLYYSKMQCWPLGRCNGEQKWAKTPLPTPHSNGDGEAGIKVLAQADVKLQWRWIWWWAVWCSDSMVGVLLQILKVKENFYKEIVKNS